MRRLPTVFLILAVHLAVAAAAEPTFPVKLDRLATTSGKLFEKVTVTRIEGDRIILYHSRGVARLEIERLTDETRKALGLPTLAEEKALETEMREKGLVEYRGEWMQPAERDARVLDDKLERMVTGKRRLKVQFMVLEVFDFGVGCWEVERHNRVGQPVVDPNSMPFFVYMKNPHTVATGEVYRTNLYHTGNIRLVTADGSPFAVQSYASSKDLAKEIVRYKYHMTTYKGERPWFIPEEAWGQERRGVMQSGTGLIITDDGYVITNHHVIADANKIEVHTDEGVLEAERVAQDAQNDLALLKVKSDRTWMPVTFAPEGGTRLGQTVFTCGFPMPDFQGFAIKVTRGVVSSLTGFRDDERMVQIDAEIQSGNSGGPLSDEYGHIVGVVAAQLDPGVVFGMTGSLPQGVNYAIKNEVVMEFLDRSPEVKERIWVAETQAEAVEFEDAVEVVSQSTVMIIASNE